MRPKNGSSSDDRHFRNVLGQFPTGVVVVCAISPDGEPCGMAVGSFGSVSLDPPLVSYMPARTSSSYRIIQQSPTFCVSILGADQDNICRAMATSGGDKFAGISWSKAPSGAPIIDGSLAWLDCTTVTVHEAGDHYIVLGEVDHLSDVSPGAPLVFLRGGYGAVTTSSLVAPPERDLTDLLRLADRSRPTMEALAQELKIECQAVGSVDGDTVALAIVNPPGATYTSARVGYRAPLTFPVAAASVAWDEAAANRWLPSEPQDRAMGLSALERVRQRRWSIALDDDSYAELERAVGHRHVDTSQDDAVTRAVGALDARRFDSEIEPEQLYDVSMLSVPVIYGSTVGLTLNLRGFGRPLTGTEIERIAARLVSAADELGPRLLNGTANAVQSATSQ